MKIGRFLHQIF